MAAKDNSPAAHSEQAAQIVRQFAWNLAGTLAGAKAGSQRKLRQPRRPAKR